ncbi:MAG TPA: tetraacyldisaccharide 4'-kinase [Vicinamibacteria bacterium]|nr:tetraacyldisaccharide 4'-kinase [Vicinamibacteria bacterium]
MSALDGLFARALALRPAAYRRGWLKPARLAGPVVSVGNLSLGGNGKTPVVRRVAEMLMGTGQPVSVLSRGYGGRFDGEALVVSDGRGVLASADQAGDEPVMLARALPGAVVAVGPRRDRVGRAVEARFGRRVHVLDDGFQHLRLARDLDLVCLDVADGSERPLPLGPLREGLQALRRADLVLLTRVEAANEDQLRALEKRLGPGRVHRVSRRVLGFRSLDGRPAERPGRAFLLAAIARPSRLEWDVSGGGTRVVGRSFFRDHHRFRAEEVATAAARARAAGADAVVTTAKDAVRMEGLPDVALPVLVLEIAAEIADEDRFRERLLAAVGGRG